ncbi:MAG: carbohydrate ABC transporter permease [Synergistaceae bacterium]|nr:carbohydrate ABC transporter permease [Synergistaceae bacterium]
MKNASIKARAVKYSVLSIFFLYAFSIVYPILWIAVTGFKSNREFFRSTWRLPTEWIYQNYIDAWNAGVGTYFFNSLLVTAASVFFTVILSAFLGFVLTRYTFKFKKLVFVLVLGGMMLSPEVSLIALFRLLQDIGLYNTYWALIITYTAFRIPFTTFLMRSYFLGLPREVEEAAFIDGCTSFQIFTKIILPMSKPIIATAALLAAMVFWNEFMFGLVFIESSALKTIPVGLMNLQGALNAKWTTMLAGLAMSAFPMILLFLLCQKQFVRGLTSGSVKG